MSPPRLKKSFALTTAIIVGFIVYGSFFPFHFYRHADAAGPLAALLATWRFKPEHFGNLIANVLLYMPLGFFGVLAIGSSLSGWIRFAAILVMGAALSFTIELLQFYDVDRVTTFADIYPNVLGTVVGSLAGIAAGPRFRLPQWGEGRTQPIPVLLLAAWLGFRLFPYVPTTDLHKYWHALKPVLLTPSLSPYHVAAYCVMWLVVAALAEALVGHPRSRRLLSFAVVLVLGAKVLIVNNTLTAAEVAGAAAACVVWLALARSSARGRSVLVMLALAAFVIAERLEPFQFMASARPFGWTPFLSFMRGSTSINTQSFLEKFFLYGSLIWLLTVTGLRLVLAALAVALGLFVTSLMETHLPGRSAQITDTVMALVIAGAFGLIAKASSRSEEMAPALGGRLSDKTGPVAATPRRTSQ